MKVLSNLMTKQFIVLTMCMILVCIAGDLSANKGLEIAILSDKNKIIIKINFKLFIS